MTMLTQPPPDAPAPPPSEAAILSQKKWKWLWVVGVGSIIIIVLAGLTAPMILRATPKSPQTEAVANARQIGLALFEFENEYGAYPNASTGVPVQTAAGTTLSLGTKSSNDFFRQLIGGNFTQSEKIFYARIKGARKPDDNITRAEALKKGECAFAYFIGAKVTDNPKRPLAATPMIPGTDRFDPKPFDGKAVVLNVDNSVTSINVDKDGHIHIDGKLLMDPTNPIWDGHPPVIVWPEL